MDRVMYMTFEEAESFDLYKEGANICRQCHFYKPCNRISDFSDNMPCGGGLFVHVDLAELSKQVQQYDDVDKLIIAGERVRAIKLYRVRKGIGLREAKEWCDLRMEELKKEGHPCEGYYG